MEACFGLVYLGECDGGVATSGKPKRNFGDYDRFVRAVLMHGHRHIDWIGKCAGLSIVSAPSPVMEATGDADTYFYIHTLAAQNDGRIGLLTSERVVVDGQPKTAG
jgi:hypothetical protein